MVKLKPATKEDVVILFGSSWKYTMKALVATIDDKPVGITGYYYDGYDYVAFSRIKEELRKYPLAIYKGAMWLKKQIKGMDIVAIADPSINRAGALLEHLGASHVGTCSRGEIYKWH